MHAHACVQSLFAVRLHVSDWQKHRRDLPKERSHPNSTTTSHLWNRDVNALAGDSRCDIYLDACMMSIRGFLQIFACILKTGTLQYHYWRLPPLNCRSEWLTVSISMASQKTTSNRLTTLLLAKVGSKLWALHHRKQKSLDGVLS